MMSARLERFRKKFADTRDSIGRLRKRHITKYFGTATRRQHFDAVGRSVRSAHPVDALIASMACMTESRFARRSP
jgi:hypothetical protein